jgi:hypothetical protein
MTHGGIISDQDFEQAKLEMNEATEKAVIKDIYHIRKRQGLARTCADVQTLAGKHTN